MGISSLKNRAFLVLFLLLLFVSNTCFAQTPDSSKIEKIEKIFEAWDPESPGCVCAINKGGETFFQKGYGMANLELDVPLSPDSVFYIASTSKQFTAASIAMLSLSGKVTLDSSIKEYIPGMPDYAKDITVKNLLHHTSGIRDYLDVLALKGWTEKEYLNNDIIVDLITRQKGVLFPPGERYAYSNSNYVLLAEIVKRTSGTTLNEYSRDNIFEPLGMNNTHFDDNYETIVKNRVSSYGYNGDGKYFRYLKAFDGVGDGNLLTTVNDLFKWEQNFKDHKIGGKEFTDLLLTRGKLNNGKELGYAFGLMLWKYRGLNIISHPGGFNGFKTEFMRFPEQNFSVAVLCNVVDANPTLIAQQVSDIFFDDIMTPKELPPTKPKIERKEIHIDPALLDKYVGRYQLPRGMILNITKEGNQLMLRVAGQPKFPIFPESMDKFFLKAFEAQATFQPEQNKLIWHQGGSNNPAELMEEVIYTPEELQQYTGDYYSEEILANYRIFMENGLIYLKVGYRPKVEMQEIRKDEFFAGFSLRFIRSKYDEITGFEIDAERVQHLKFSKKRAN